MRKFTFAILLSGCVLAVHGQTVLTLDSCRALALRNNKQINVSRLSKEVAMNTRKAARTKYLPKVDVLAGYEFTSRNINLLSNKQKNMLNNMGTNLGTQVGGDLQKGISEKMTELVKQGAISMQQAQQIGSMIQQAGAPIGQYAAGIGNTIGQQIVDAFRTDTKSVFGGAVILRQPIFMGGAIKAANAIADITEEMADNDESLKTQSTIYDIDKVYWTVVSLKHKQKLAYSYRDLVKKLDDDVNKMIRQGVATKADGLKVDVKVNEADMDITRVDDGVTLAKMLLCQLCGIPMTDKITLADEVGNGLETSNVKFTDYQPDSTFSNRPEVRLLQNAVDLSEQGTKIIQAEYLPHVALTGGYMITNPNVYNGFQKRFSGVWNVGVTVQVPVWNWFEGRYKVRASRAVTSMARMELSDVQEKINLQVTQSRFKVKEARKRLVMANNNVKSAEENLRCAQVGFREGVIPSTDVMAAQTAWQKAHSDKIDAEVDLRVSEVNMEKALGILE
jgi:outer membrane protein TolC